jgi:hypothetical protein
MPNYSSGTRAITLSKVIANGCSPCHAGQSGVRHLMPGPGQSS